MNTTDRINRNQQIADCFLKNKCSLAVLARQFNLHRHTIRRVLKSQIDYNEVVNEKRDWQRRLKLNKLTPGKKQLLKNDYLKEDAKKYMEWCYNEIEIINRKKGDTDKPVKIPIKLFKL